MSRIGKKPVELPSGVSATVSGQTIEVKGPKGTLNFNATDDVTISMTDNSVAVEPKGQSKRARQQSVSYTHLRAHETLRNLV